ncbi:MAG: hypothetical protein ACRD17_09980 [Terriglobales bacterium]
MTAHLTHSHRRHFLFAAVTLALVAGLAAAAAAQQYNRPVPNAFFRYQYKEKLPAKGTQPPP